MNYFSRLIFIFLFIIPATLFSQVDSITITHHWEFFDGDSTIDNSVDSFSMGIHVGKYVYDVNNNPVARTNYIRSQQGLTDSVMEKCKNGAWVNFRVTHNQFYSNDSLHVSTEYIYIDNAGVFDTNGTRVTITFDSITNTKIILHEEMYYNSPWSISRRENYTYDTLNRVSYYLLESGATFQPSWDQYNYFLSNDSIDYYLYRTYQSGVLMDTDSVVNSYNSNGFLIESTTYNIWNVNLSRPYSMKSYTYDFNNNILSSCGHLWDQVFGWYAFPDTTWSTYNSNNQIVESKTNYDGGGGHHFWYFYDGLNRLDSVHYVTWPMNGDTHFWYYKMEYPLLSSINTNYAGNNLQLFPNPSSDKIFLKFKDSFNLKKIEITDVNGRTLKTKLCNDAIESIDISQLHPGIYYLHSVFSDRKEETVNFVKTN